MKAMTSERICKAAGLVLFQLFFIAAGSLTAFGAESQLINIREGLYADHSRIVMDCKGAMPTRIGPARSDFFSVAFEDLTVVADIDKISRRLRGSVHKIFYQKDNGSGMVRLYFKKQGARVKAFVLKSDDGAEKGYRIVMDVFPEYPASTVKETPSSKPALKTAASAAPLTAAAGPPAPAASPSPEMAPAQPLTAAESEAAEKKTAAPTLPSEAKPAESSAAGDRVEAGSPEEPAETTGWTYAGEVRANFQTVDGDKESAKSDEYRDISQPVSGGFTVKAEKDRRHFIRGKATHIGRDDQFVGGEGGSYGKYEVDVSYDKSIHRYAYDAKTLYSGVGSGVMSLDDALQANVQAAPNPVETANRLNGFLSAASSGDPDVTRDKLKLGLNVFALDPFSFKVEFGHEKKEGTRPYAGNFLSTQMVELFEPIDYDTLEMKVSGEYASAPVYLNLSYQYSQFTNNIDTLTFDNPLVATDGLFQPSSGQMDLAPDNQYHNLSLTGAYTKLPGNSQISANAALGVMLQDDALVPFTTNTALASPALPVESADAEVHTQLYSLRLTSNPLPWLRIKGHARHYDYDNQTDEINFTNGYVETDAFVTGIAVTNLPSSYSKTRAGLDLGFDIGQRTGLGLGYQYESTNRENREVEEQDDHTFKASADNRALTWLDIRASYERTERDIGDYNFDVYRLSGDDLEQLPQLRKYDQADLTRDRIRLQTTFFPSEPLSFGASAAYGKDDFKDSPYGLLEDSHLLLSFDTTYAAADRVSVNLFYSYEQYENTQRGNDGTVDWSAEGEDQIHTAGARLNLVLVPDRMDLDLTYSYSDVDGNIAFTSPTISLADFTAVDDTKIHAFDSKLKYHFTKHFSLSLGYIWEKFDYDDFSTEGFSLVPTDTAGNYQGALLSGTLPKDYDVHIVYTQLVFRYY